jgi:hypothetical protein
VRCFMRGVKRGGAWTGQSNSGGCATHRRLMTKIKDVENSHVKATSAKG